jgi:hypothetical protein
MNPRPRHSKRDFGRARHDGSSDPAVAGLAELIGAELEQAQTSEPELLAAVDPGRVWLLWYSVGATVAVCQLTGCTTDVQRDGVFRAVVTRIFDGRGIRSDVDPVQADQSLIELFESAGAEAVAACMRGDRKLGYYVEALRVGQRHEP